MVSPTCWHWTATIESGAGGSFAAAASAAGIFGSPYLLSLSSSCEAVQVPYGASCTGSAGQVQLIGVSRPWLGGTWRARAQTLPSAALLVAQVVGFPSWPTPLVGYLVEGQPGCQLLVSPELIDLLPAGGGVAESAWPVPDVAALVGQSLGLQHVPFEFGPGGLTGAFASNALLATVDSY